MSRNYKNAFEESQCFVFFARVFVDRFVCTCLHGASRCTAAARVESTGRPPTYVNCTDWPIIEAKITDFLIRLAVQSNGTELHLRAINSVRAHRKRYSIRAKLQLPNASEQWCNLEIEEEYAMDYAKIDD